MALFGLAVKALFTAQGAVVAGAAVTAASQVQAGRAAKAQAETESDIAAYNARLKEAEAREEQRSAAEAAKQFAKEAEALTARQRVLFAKGGVAPSKGSALAVVVKTAQELEADRLAILREGMVSSAQRRAEANIFRLRGGAARARGRAAVRGSRLAAAGTILSAVGSAGLAARTPSTRGVGGTGTGPTGGVQGPRIRR